MQEEKEKNLVKIGLENGDRLAVVFLILNMSLQFFDVYGIICMDWAFLIKH